MLKSISLKHILMLLINIATAHYCRGLLLNRI